jgi:hypothetical protein
MGGDDDSEFTWWTGQDLRVSETGPICRAWPTRGACIRREVAERRQGSVWRRLVSRRSHPGRTGSQGIAFPLTAPAIARSPGRRAPVVVETFASIKACGFGQAWVPAFAGMSGQRQLPPLCDFFTSSSAGMSGDFLTDWSAGMSDSHARPDASSRRIAVRNATPEPHAPKIDQPILLVRASSATRPRWELPFASRPGDQVAMDALPGAIARMPPPTPLLPGNPTR